MATAMRRIRHHERAHRPLLKEGKMVTFIEAQVEALIVARAGVCTD